MSDEQTADQPTEDPKADSTDRRDAATSPEPQGGDDAAKLRKEAASWRKKLREAEKKIDQQAERISRFERQEVERVASETLADPGDLWRSGVELDQLRAEDGSLDTDKVKGTAKQLAKDHPHYAKPRPSFDGGVREAEPKGGPSFGEALKRAAG